MIKIFKLLRKVLNLSPVKLLILESVINNVIHDLIKSRLRKIFSKKLSNNPLSKCQIYKGNSKIVWVSWWQGFEEAPDIVKSCINSIHKNVSKEFEVILIDKNNFQNFVDIPDFILQKHRAGIITNTHFSDILRWALLSSRGGMWVDSTIFLTKNIDNLLEKDFFTFKTPNSYGDKFISKGRWTGFFICINGQHKSAKLIYELLCVYWENEEKLKDYFLIDYVLDYVYDKDDVFKKLIDNDCVYNSEIYILSNNLFSVYNDDFKYNIHKSKYGVHKLSYKINLDDHNNSYDTVYYNFILN